MIRDIYGFILLISLQLPLSLLFYCFNASRISDLKLNHEQGLCICTHSHRRKKLEWLKDIIRFVCEKWGIIQLQLTSPHFLWKIINCNWRRCQLNLLLNLLSATYLWSTNTHKRDCEGEKILENHHMLFLLFLFSLLRYVKVRIMFTCLRDC